LNNNYTCTQPAMMQQWRNDFGVPNAFFGIVQLSTWCPTQRGTPDALAQLRVSQVASLAHPSDACKFGAPPLLITKDMQLAPQSRARTLTPQL
jgi:hypothetical protein